VTPLVTIGVVSFNRLHYLRSLLASARECIQYPNVQWIVADGCSVEPGLRDYLQAQTWLDDVAFVESGALADAMNAIVARTQGEYLLIIPDDVQFIVSGNWMADAVELMRDKRVGVVGIDAQRRQTIQRQFDEAYLRVRGHRVALPFSRTYRRFRSRANGLEFIGYGRTVPGISTGGLSLSRTSIWRRLGPWRTTMEGQLTNDASLGTEDDMLRRYKASGMRLERFLMCIQPMVHVITDPRGTSSKVRVGNRRYGKYFPPPHGRFYYRIWELDEAKARFGHLRPAAAFEDVAEPIGWELPIDDQGNLKKVSVIREDEPYELVAP
jgi:glycosyltransferase involved in cell wall biosynthesis